MKPISTMHVETGENMLGGPMQVLYLMKGLIERGHRAELVCTETSAICREALGCGLTVHPIPFKGESDPGFIIRLKRIIMNAGVDVVHLHSRRGADVFGGIAGRLAGTPAVILSRRVDDPIRLISKLKFGRSCDRIIAVSEGIANVLKNAGVNSAKVRCVHSAIDAKKYQKPGFEDTTRDSLGLPPDVNVVTVIAQLIERKGHKYLLNAAPIILKQFPSTVFIILGEGRMRSDLEKLTASISIEKHVKFTGFRSDIGEVLSITDVLVHPATMEGFANSVLQAMAAEVPVVCSAVGGMPESVRDGINGILVPPADEQALAKAVIHLLASPDIRKEMGRAGRHIVETEYNVDTMVEGVLKVYEETLNSKALK